MKSYRETVFCICSAEDKNGGENGDEDEEAEKGKGRD